MLYILKQYLGIGGTRSNQGKDVILKQQTFHLPKKPNHLFAKRNFFKIYLNSLKN